MSDYFIRHQQFCRLNRLPEHVAFGHGDEKTWHQEGYAMSYMLINMCFKNDAWRPIKGSRSYFKGKWSIVELFLGSLPKDGFKEKCCAQFVVLRERIKARPRVL